MNKFSDLPGDGAEPSGRGPTPNPTHTAKSPADLSATSAMEPASSAGSTAVGNWFTPALRWAVGIGIGGALAHLFWAAAEHVKVFGWVSPAIRNTFDAAWPTLAIFGAIVFFVLGWVLRGLSRSLRADFLGGPDADAGITRKEYAEAAGALVDARELLRRHHSEDYWLGEPCPACVRDGESPEFDRLYAAIERAKKRLGESK